MADVTYPAFYSIIYLVSMWFVDTICHNMISVFVFNVWEGLESHWPPMIAESNTNVNIPRFLVFYLHIETMKALFVLNNDIKLI